MALTERADRRLAHGREGFRKQIVELLAVGQTLAKDVRLPAQFVVAERRDVGLEPVDRVDIFAEAADIAIVGRSEDAFCHCGEHGIPLKTRAFRKRRSAGEIASGDVRSDPLIVN